MDKNGPITYRHLVRLIIIAAAVGVAVWLAHSMLEVLLIFFLALIIGIILNAPAVWLETKKVPRPVAASLVLLVMVGVVAGIG